jgi:hypothetical protein
VRIITWNANRRNRWALLWADALVAAGAWDVICLQEAGNPDIARWAHVGGPVWNPVAALRATNEPVVFRRYTYNPLGYLVHILHAEWPNRQKNHMVIITKAPASWAGDLSGQMSERPAIGIKVRLTWPPGIANTDILLGCVHIVANRRKSPQEVFELLPYVNTMCQHVPGGVAGWMLIGDFNCDPSAMLNAVLAGLRWPLFQTQRRAPSAIDYLIMDVNLHAAFVAAPGMIENWAQGATAISDHWLVEYAQVNGPTVQIL